MRFTDLDTPFLDAGQLAEIAKISAKTVHNWTDRSFADPYRSVDEVQRTKGRARSYSVRDALRFYLGGRLHAQYRTPLPQLKQICRMVFGEAFNAKTAAYIIIRENKQGTAGTEWCADMREVEAALKLRPVATVLDVRNIFDDVIRYVENLP